MKKYILIIGLFVTSLAFSQGGYTRPPQGTGTVTSIETASPITGGTITVTGTIGITQSTISTDGYLSLIDWNVFNDKENSLGFTPYNATNPSGYTSNTGTVTSVTAGSGMTQTGTSTINPTLNIIGGNGILVNADNIELTTLSSDWDAGNTFTITAFDFIGSSDKRLKTKIEPLSTIIDINYKEYYFKSRPGKKRYGVIAQELEINNPELVHTNKDGFKSVSYIDLHSIEISNIKKQMNHLQEENNLQNLAIVLLILACFILGVFQGISIFKRK